MLTVAETGEYHEFLRRCHNARERREPRLKWTDCNFAWFNEKKTANVHFLHVDMDDVDFGETDLGSSIFESCSLARANLSRCSGSFTVQSSDLSRANLTEFKTSGGSFRQCRFVEATLFKSALRPVSMIHCDFTRADLRDAQWDAGTSSNCSFAHARVENLAWRAGMWRAWTFTGRSCSESCAGQPWTIFEVREGAPVLYFDGVLQPVSWWKDNTKLVRRDEYFAYYKQSYVIGVLRPLIEKAQNALEVLS